MGYVPASTQGARSWAGSAMAAAQSQHGRGDAFFMRGLQDVHQDKRQVLDAVRRFVEARRAAKQRQEMENRRDSKGLFGIGGAAGGALIGTLIAPGVGTLVGAGIGGAAGAAGDALYTETPNAGAYAQQSQQYLNSGIQAYAAADGGMMRNPYYMGNTTAQSDFDYDAYTRAVTLETTGIDPATQDTSYLDYADPAAYLTPGGAPPYGGATPPINPGY